MVDSASTPPLPSHPPRPLGFLVWIVLYKMIKVVGTIAGGIIALVVRDRLVEVTTAWLSRLGFDPEGKVATTLIARVSGVSSRNLGIVAAVCFLYAAMYLIESVGLYYEKRWAEWFTALQTSLLIPLEIYGLCHGMTVFKWLMLAMSLTTVSYLLWRIRHDQFLDEEEVREAEGTTRAPDQNVHSPQ